MISVRFLLLFCATLTATPPVTTAFSASRHQRAAFWQRSSATAAATTESRPTSTATTVVLFASTTVEAPTREETDRKTDRKRRSSDDDNDDENNNNNSNTDYPDLEYLQDWEESREMEDPFHILLLGSTFEKPKVTVDYVCGSLQYVLGMPQFDAKELASFAQEHGMSCLGTWPREECLSLGKQLQVRDIVCRVVPYAEGGQRGWQAKDASNAGSSRANSGSGWSSQ